MSLLTIALFVLVSKSLCIILPMTKPSGDPDLTSMLNHITLLEQRLEKVEEDDRTSVVELATLKADNQQLQYEIMTLKNAAPTGVYGNANGTPNVSFLAEALINQTLDRHEVLKFGNVVYNRGNGYRATSGIFTVPVTGTYIIWAQVLYSRSGDEFYTITLQKEGSIIANGYGETSSNIQKSTASINVYIDLDLGDQIWFTNHNGEGYIIASMFSRYGAMLISAK